MERLTKKVGNEYLTTEGESEVNWCDFVEKLGKLEDLEEEIGCPLKVRCQLHNGKCVYGEHDKERILNIWVNGIVTMRLVDKKKTMHKFSNYKVTWWLKEDRSE